MALVFAKLISRCAMFRFLLFLLVATASAQPLQFRGAWPGFPRGRAQEVKAQGNYAYVAADNGGLMIIDISIPAEPVVVGGYDTFGVARGIDVVGDYAYVADGFSGLSIIDCHDPRRPFRAGHASTGGQAYKVHVVNGYAYVAAALGGLRVIDVRNPTAPLSVARRSGYPMYAATDVHVADNYAFVGDAEGLFVFDVSSPSNPQLVGSFSNERADAIHVVGQYAYVATPQSGFTVLDVSNPTNITSVARSIGFGGFTDIFVSDGFAWLGSREAGLTIYDVANPSSPVYRARISDSSGSTMGVYKNRDLIFLANDIGGVDILQAANPVAPVLLNNIPFGESTAVDILGNRAYLFEWNTGLQILDLTDVSNPVRIGHFKTNWNGFDVSAVGDYAYVAAYEDGLQIINVRNPAAPTLAGGLRYNGSFGWADFESVEVRGSYAYACTSSDGLLIVDVANAAAPTLVARGGPGSAWDIHFVDDLAFVAAGSQGLMIYNATNPTNLTWVGGLANLASARKVYVRSNLAYVIHRQIGLEILDISNPAAPVHRAFYDTGDYGSGLSVVATNAYVADLFFGVQEIDVTVPTAPRRVRTYYPPGGAVYLKAGEPFFYVVDASSGLQIYSLSPQPRPTLSIQNRDDGTTVSWSPWLPGQILETADALSPTNWIRSSTGGASPVISPTTDPRRLFRVFAR